MIGERALGLMATPSSLTSFLYPNIILILLAIYKSKSLDELNFPLCVGFEYMERALSSLPLRPLSYQTTVQAPIAHRRAHVSGRRDSFSCQSIIIAATDPTAAIGSTIFDTR